MSTESTHSSQMGHVSHPASFSIDGEEFPITSLDEFTFTIQAPSLAERYQGEPNYDTQPGSLRLGEEDVEVQFRYRTAEGDNLRCGFYDLPIKQREKIVALYKKVVAPVSDELHTLSYDELATGSSTKSEAAKTDEPTEGSSASKKLAATLVMGAGMLAIVGWIVYAVGSRSTISVRNGVMVGNYHAINTPFEGELQKVLVAIGDRVEPGQPIALIGNKRMAQELELAQAKLRRAQRVVTAHKLHLHQIEATLKFAQSKIAHDRLIAEADMLRIDAQLQSNRSQMDRLEPLYREGNIALVEFEEIKGLHATLEAEKVRQAAVIDRYDLVKEAVSSDVLIGDASVSNPLADTQTEIAIAQAEVDELTELVESIEAQSSTAELVSQQTGTVHAIYRRQGEFLKVADEAMALSLDDGGWATGHVTTTLATKVKPGQKVEIEIPSLGLTTKGTVSGMGHRAVYGRGGYNAAFRSGPDDVPIRVAIDELDEHVPSGLRLNMTVRVHDHLATMRSWVDGLLGREPSEASASATRTESGTIRLAESVQR